MSAGNQLAKKVTINVLARPSSRRNGNEYMKRQIKSGLLALALTAALTGFALPGLARADVRVNVGAIEYDNSFTVVSVLAVFSNPGADLDAWKLASVFRNGTEPLPLIDVEAHSFALLRSKLWVVKISGGNLISAGDTVTAVVDLDGTAGTTEEEDTATCGPGVRRTHITAICK